MNKKSAVAYVAAAYLLTFNANCSALSIEARETIESLREKLEQKHDMPKIETKVSVYTPGEELRAALERLRGKKMDLPVVAQMIDESSIESPSVITRVSFLDPEYKVGELLSKKIAKLKILRNSKGNALSEKAPVNMEFAESVKISATEKLDGVKQVVSGSKISENLKTPKTTGQTSKIKIDDNQSQMIKAKISILAQEKLSKTEANSSTSVPVKTGHDKEFNADIRKYEFKMPENYRIIVR